MGNTPPLNKKDPTQFVQLSPITGTGIPAGFCQSQSFLPWVSQQGTNGPMTQLICQTSLQLNIPNYKAYNYGGQYNNYLSQRMFFQPLDAQGRAVDVVNVDRYCLTPQGCTLVQIICLQVPLPQIPTSPQAAVDYYVNSIKTNADAGRTANKNIYSYSYILKVQDAVGNQHYVYESDTYVSGQRAAKYDVSMLPDFTPNTGNMIIGGQLNITNIAAYAIFDMPSSDSVAYSLHQDPQYALKTNSTMLTGGGYFTFYQQATPGSMQLPPGMSIIGLGCMKDCTLPVIIAGYKYDLQDVLNFQVGVGFPMLKYVTVKYGKSEVYNYLVAMMQWAYDIGLQYFSTEQAKKMNDMLGLIISGQYGLYGDVNLFNGKVDDYMAYYCSNNKDKAICACYASNSPSPMCSDRICQTVGYRSAKVLSQNCDPYNNLDAIKGLVNTQGATTQAQYQSMIDQQTKTQADLVLAQQTINTSASQLQQQVQQQLQQQQSSMSAAQNQQQQYTTQQLTDQQAYIQQQLSSQQQFTAAQLASQQQLLKQLLTDQSAQINNQLDGSQQSINSQLQQYQSAISQQLQGAQQATDGSLANQQQYLNQSLQGQQEFLKKSLQDQSGIVQQQIQSQQQQLQDHQQALDSMIQHSQQSVAQQLADQQIKMSQSLTDAQIQFATKGEQLIKNMDSVNVLVAQFGQQYLTFKDYLDTLHADSQSVKQQITDYNAAETSSDKYQRNILLVIMLLVVIVVIVSILTQRKIGQIGKSIQRFADKIFDF